MDGLNVSEGEKSNVVLKYFTDPLNQTILVAIVFLNSSFLLFYESRCLNDENHENPDVSDVDKEPEIISDAT